MKTKTTINAVNTKKIKAEVLFDFDAVLGKTAAVNIVTKKIKIEIKDLDIESLRAFCRKTLNQIDENA